MCGEVVVGDRVPREAGSGPSGRILQCPLSLRKSNLAAK